MSNKKRVILEAYTDGACRGQSSKKRNKNVQSSAGFVLRGKDHYLAKQVKYFPEGTNSTAELMAVDMLLMYILEEGLEHHFIHVYTDSQTVYNTFTNWIHKWKNNGWKRANGAKVLNVGIIQRIQKKIEMCHNIHFHWVRGHAGNLYNEEIDQLCQGMFK